MKLESTLYAIAETVHRKSERILLHQTENNRRTDLWVLKTAHLP